MHTKGEHMVYQAFSCHKDLFELLQQNSFEGAVHSVFHRVLNVHIPSGDFLFTIASDALDNAPFTVRVRLDGSSDFRTLIETGIRVTAGKEGVRLEKSLFVPLKHPTLWQPKLLAFPPDRRLTDHNLQVLRKRLRTLPGGCGMAGLFSYGNAGGIFERALSERANKLLEALARKDISSIHQAILGLIGLGPGLTPSGDDFLLGMICCGHVPGAPFAAYSDIFSSAVLQNRLRTNDISYAALLHGTKGQMREYIAACINALMYEDNTAALHTAIDRVLQIGSTSGYDICAGIYFGLCL